MNLAEQFRRSSVRNFKTYDWKLNVTTVIACVVICLLVAKAGSLQAVFLSEYPRTHMRTNRPAAATVAAPILKWVQAGCFSSWCQTGWYSSPAVSDLDGDGQPEVLWGSYDLIAVSGVTGQLRWRASSNNRVWPGVAIADLNADGSTEIIVGRSGGLLTVYNTSGAVVWSRTPFGDGSEIRTMAVDDLEQDGRLEIIVGKAGAGSTRQLCVLGSDGTVRPGWPARRDGEPGYGWGMYNQNVAVGDLNGDGLKEIIGPTDTHYITALDRNGNQLPVSSVYGAGKVWSQVGVHVDHAVDLRGYANCGVEHRPNFADSPPVIADLNRDGVKEIVVVGNVYNCGTDPYTSLYQMPFIFKADRTRWSGNGFDWTSIPVPGPGRVPLSEDYTAIETAEPNPVVADLDGDGFKEILFASYDGKVHAYWLDKTEHGNWPYDVPGVGIRFASEPVVADLDNDGHAEVLFSSWPEKVAGRLGQIHILDYNGNPLQAVDLPDPLGEDWNGGVAAPTLANIDADSDLEIVVGTVASGLVAYDLPGTSQARILWGTGRGNMERTGAVSESMKNDFNEDGYQDIFWRNTATGQNLVWFMHGTTYSGSAVLSTVPDTSWRIVGTSDFNRDGKTDIVWRNSLDGRNLVWLMNGVSFLQSVQLNTVANQDWKIVGIGDFNLDGMADVLWRNAADGRNLIWLMNETDFLQKVDLNGVSNLSWEIMGTGDFNQDYRTDIVWHNSLDGRNLIWLMNGTFFLQAVQLNTVANQDWKIVGTGDSDLDGKTDILWRNSSDGRNTVWLMNGTSYREGVQLNTVPNLSWQIVIH